MKRIKLAALLISIGLSLAVIMSVFSANVSLTSIKSSKMQPLWKMKNFSATSSPEGYSPAQIKSAYGIDSNFGTGKGKTIAIVTAYGSENLTSDLNVFNNTFKLPSAKITIHDCGVTDSDSDWALETTLDTEWAHVMAPDAKLVVVEAVSDDSDDLLDAVDYAVKSGAQIVSMSWGGDEYDSEIEDDQHFSKSGVVFVSASGDDGTGAVWPSSSSKVISVSGTTLNLDEDGNRISETAWSSSGGGTSLFEAIPSWQSTFGIKSYARVSPDVSFDADPYTGTSVYCSVPIDGSAGWYQMGGTSLGAPAWAGIIACLNQNGDCINDAGSLYSLAGGTGYTNANKSFYDIVSGSNGYRASAGYDKATGLGSPDGDNLVADGVSYSAYVQRTGWQPSVSNGTQAGTTGKNLRVEALKLKLFGSLPKGASIIYQTHVQKLGWQKAVSDGAQAGTTGKSLRVEAVRITLSGLPGYDVKYRTYVQGKGWMSWQTTQNGAAIASAASAGTIGQSLRVEAIQIFVNKTGS